LYIYQNKLKNEFLSGILPPGLDLAIDLDNQISNSKLCTFQLALIFSLKEVKKNHVLNFAS